MSRRHQLAAAAGVAAALTLAGVGLWAAAAPHPQGAAAAPPPSHATSATPTRAGVAWLDGPWGPATMAGRAVLLPASPIEGPLRDHGNGWADGYRPTALAAAIALLRAGPMAAAAPPALHAQVDAAVLTEQADRAELVGQARNTEPAWTLPEPMLAAARAAVVRLLGVVVDLHGHTADARVYQAVAGDGGDTLLATDYQLRYTGGQWRVHRLGASTVVPAGPPAYTLPAPSEG